MELVYKEQKLESLEEVIEFLQSLTGRYNVRIESYEDSARISTTYEVNS